MATAELAIGIADVMAKIPRFQVNSVADVGSALDLDSKHFGEWNPLEFSRILNPSIWISNILNQLRFFFQSTFETKLCFP